MAYSAKEFKKYGSDKELDKLVDSKSWQVRREVAKQDYGLDKLINDENIAVRYQVVKQGYGLDKFINDETWEARREVARQGYGLDKLIKDRDWRVRTAVAEQGYGLSRLINDKECAVRCAVAEQGYALDKLINDKSYLVRESVAQQGYGLDKLVNDENKFVRWTVALQRYGFDKLISDEDESVRHVVDDKLDGRTIVEWWESAPKENRHYKDMKSMPKGLQTNFAIVVVDMALGGERIIGREMHHDCDCKHAENVLLDVTHSYGNDYSIGIHRSPSDKKYTVTIGFPGSIWGGAKAEFEDIEELISLLHSAKSQAAEMSEELAQALSKAINAVESLIG